MKFFIPRATPENTERIYESIKAFVKTTLGWDVSDRRIFRIEYFHNGKEHKAEVGTLTDVNHEEVIAILECNSYFVCTPTRGVVKGMPILVGTDEITSIEDFD
jgi:hypothetical protein